MNCGYLGIGGAKSVIPGSEAFITMMRVPIRHCTRIAIAKEYFIFGIGGFCGDGDNRGVGYGEFCLQFGQGCDD